MFSSRELSLEGRRKKRSNAVLNGVSKRSNNLGHSNRRDRGRNHETMSEVLDEARVLLKQLYGYDDFRPAQADVIESILEGFDTFAFLPTGYGKSVTFQIPAMMCDGLTLVVSPLIALMKDQCDDCERKGIPATYVNSTQKPMESEQELARAATGDVKLLYVSPERMYNAQFQSALRQTEVSMIAVDEAHSASRWGHDFRPAYMQIKKMINMFKRDGRRPVVLAVTATATPEVEDDIRVSLGLSSTRYRRFAGDPVRPNFRYSTVIEPRSSWMELSRVVTTGRNGFGGRHLVYSTTRKGAEMAAKVLLERLNLHNFLDNTDPIEVSLKSPIQFYHAGMTAQHRTAVQESFKDGKCWCVCATNAFGMGIDVPDIRTVTHLGIPGSVEDYVQESGRGGRDGKSTHAHLLVDEFSINLQQRFIDNVNPPLNCYRWFWAWAQHASETCSGGQEIVIPMIHIAKKINALLDLNVDNPDECISADRLRGVLAVLESQGVLVRGKSAGHLDLIVELALCRIWLADNKNDTMLRKMVGALVSIGRGTVNTDVETLAKQAGVPDDKVTYTLSALEKKGLLTREASFIGRSFTIDEEYYSLPFEEAVKAEVIEQNRARANARLAAMIAYAQAPDKAAYIRNYFATGLNIAPSTVT